MSRPGRFLGSSVGRKAIMAISGLLLCCFLLLHLIGNLSLLIADDGSLTARPGGQNASEHFVGVVATYYKIPALLYVLEVLLAALFLTHISLGITLWWQNRRARGSRYRVHKWEGGRTLGSASMPLTGVWLILTFLVIHLINFRFGPQDGPESMARLVDVTLRQWYWALIYGVALVGLMLHVSHGLQSAFQSLGVHHPRFTAKAKKLGWAFALTAFAGFGSLPLLFLLKGVGG